MPPLQHIFLPLATELEDYLMSPGGKLPLISAYYDRIIPSQYSDPPIVDTPNNRGRSESFCGVGLDV